MIGDVLTSSILFEALRKKFPEAELHYLIQPHTVPVVQDNPHIDECIIYDPGLNLNPFKFAKFLNKVKKQGYTNVIDVYSKISTGMISFYSGAECRLSYEKRYTRHFYTRTFHPIKAPGSFAGWAIENRMQFLQEFQEDFPAYLRPKIHLEKHEKKKAAQRLRKGGINLNQPLIMCGILGSSRKKSYPSAYMALLLDAIVKHLKEPQILLNYLPGQEQAALKIVSLCSPSTQSRIFPELYNRKLEDYIACCANCHSFIGNEGGAVHIAKAMEIPTFSIFSPQIEKENWSIYEDAKQNVSVHISDFKPEIKQLSKKEIRKKSAAFYELLQPNLIFAKLDIFLKEVFDSKMQETK
ncbi:MAG: glycosyltransferase family 9 protein [Salinimicrobium sp.]